MKKGPPRSALRFLRWFCREDYLEEIEGDLTELFEKQSEQAPGKASWTFYGRVLRYFRPDFIKTFKTGNPLQYTGMFQHYFKIVSRQLVRKKTFSFINIFGLVLGMSAFLLILNYVVFELSFDKFHEKGEHIYRIRNDHFSEGVFEYGRAITYRDAGPSLKEDIPEVLDFTRMNGLFGRSLSITYLNKGGKATNFFEENVYYVDDNFLDMFSFPLVKGDAREVLKNTNSVVITEKIGVKYFGAVDPIGKLITVSGDQSFYVTGVLKNIPPNSHMSFDFLFPIKSLPEYQNRFAEKWSGSGGDVAYTYILVKNTVDPVDLEKKLPAFLEKYQREIVADAGVTDQFILQPLVDIHLYSDIGFEMTANGNSKMVTFLMIIASLVLLIAWVNYINLTTVRATERAKEVGIRKVIGATKGHLTLQFLLEALIFNVIAFMLSIVLVLSLFPLIKNYTGLPFDFLLFRDISPGIFISVLLAGSILSGLYPSFVMSSFKSVEILKGKSAQKLKGISLVRGLTIFQYAISVALIAGTLTVFKQVDFMLNRDLGINVDQVIVLKAPQAAKKNYASLLNSFRTEILSYPDFVEVSASSEIPGNAFNATSWVGQPKAAFSEFKKYPSAWIDYDFLPLFELTVLKGRNFSKDFSTDENAVLVNEEFIRSSDFLSLDQAIGQSIITNRGDKKIIGVVDNYHQVSLKNAIEPVVFFLNSDRNRKYLSLKVKTTNLPNALNLLQSKYEVIFSNDPFEFFFLDNHVNQQYQADKLFGKTFLLFSLLAIFITCMGLFNLSYITTTNRIKEIAIRKIVGASISNILFLVSIDFIKLILIGIFIGVPAIWWILHTWLSNYAFRIELSMGFMIAPIFIILIIAGFTMAYHIIKAARSNPAECLRNE